MLHTRRRTLRANGRQLNCALRPAIGTQAAPCVGMQHSRSSWSFDHSSTSSVIEHSLAVVELSRPLVEAVQRKDRDLASQLRRAISSICLNLAEGFGCAGGNARPLRSSDGIRCSTGQVSTSTTSFTAASRVARRFLPPDVRVSSETSTRQRHWKSNASQNALRASLRSSP
jgi:hypothetical protein